MSKAYLVLSDGTVFEGEGFGAPVEQVGELVFNTSVVGYITITDLTRVINNTASRTMQPLLTTMIGMLIYLALSYLVFGLFALTDRRRGGAEP